MPPSSRPIDRSRVARWSAARFILVVLILAVYSGCSKLPTQRSVGILPSSPDLALLKSEYAVRDGGVHLMHAEEAYAAATLAEKDNAPSCVDHYFNAAKHAWCEIQEQLARNGCCGGRAVEIYQSSLYSLIETADDFHRFEKSIGLRIQDLPRNYYVRTTYRGFTQLPEDFSHVENVESYKTDKLHRLYQYPGLGAPVIVTRCDDSKEDFRRGGSVFPATVLLREEDGESVLEFCDPLRVESIDVRGVAVDIKRDLSAPFAKALESHGLEYLDRFLQPNLTDPEETGLFMIEPYQRGKIPVIFIHGLLSDRLTWANMLNELVARTDFLQKFQAWSFEYPTGEPFLVSAARLRKQIQTLRQKVDPNHCDPMLDQIILVGHSMGGLISTAQVTASEDYLWCSIAKLPFDLINIPAGYGEKLRDAFFFEASPSITRVVYIGTPHHGSVYAQRPVGKIGSLLIEVPAESKKAHQALVDANPGVFEEEFRNRLPTSIDLLEPSSKLLQAVRTLPRSELVQLHSIIGDDRWTLSEGATDGVVAVSSARIHGVVSESIVETSHTQLTQDLRVIDEINGILRHHYESVAGHNVPTAIVAP